MNLLLAYPEDGREVLPEGLPDRAAAGGRRPRGKRAGKELSEVGGDPNDLRAQPWAAVLPAGPAGDALAAALTPLVEARSEAMGRPAVVLRAPQGLDGAEAERWCQAAWGAAWEFELDRPRFVLVVGSYETFPPGLDERIGTDARVGRLPFDRPEPVAAYVAKLLAAPDAAPGLRVYAAEDGTAATAVGRTLVVDPALRACGAWAARSGRPYSPELVRDPCDGSARSVLLTLSHGVGPPRGGWASRAAREAEQGALSLGRGDRLVADDVRAGPFVEGGAWVAWACFGAGTPRQSAYAAWLRALAAAGGEGADVGAVLAGLPGPREPAFASALACAALANPRGPLVVVGHLDLAWTFAATTEQGTPLTGAIEELVRPLLAGHRAGLALEGLVKQRAQADTLLAQAVDRAIRSGADVTAAAEARARLWLRRHDLAGWVLLGDPAARLGPERAAVETRPPRAERPAPPPPLPPGGALPSLAPIGGAPRPLAPLGTATLPGDLEDAILDLLRGEGAPATLAAEAGVSLAELQRLAGVYRDAGRAAALRAGGGRAAPPHPRRDAGRAGERGTK